MPSRRSNESWERWVRETLQGSHLKEPPGGTLRKAVALGGRLRPEESAAGRWLAKLVFDSAAEPLPAGVRGEAAGERRLLYQIPPGTLVDEGGQLDLRLVREPRGTVELIGQVLPPVADAWVEARVARTRRRQRLGDDGEFLLRGLPSRAGELRLEIRREGEEPLVFEGVPLLSPKDG